MPNGQKKNKVLNNIRNAEGESNEHKNQNKSPRTSAMEDEEKKNVLLFFLISIAFKLFFCSHLSNEREIQESSATLGIVIFFFWQTRECGREMRTEYISTE